MGMDIDVTKPTAIGEPRTTCNVTYDFGPGNSVIEGTDDVISLFDDTPEPEVAFIEVNGVPASRVSGNISLFGVTFPANTQIMVQGDFFYLITCFGSTRNDGIDLIFNSIEIF